MKVIAQGDPIEYDVEHAADACRLYRQDMTEALIGVVTYITDYERVKRNAETIRLQQEYISQLQDSVLRLTAERDELRRTLRQQGFSSKMD